MSSSVGETADSYGCGVIVDLDRVPLKYEGLAPWEIYVSESQERMLIVVPPENLQKALAVFEKEDVEATAIGTLTTEKRLILRYEGKQWRIWTCSSFSSRLKASKPQNSKNPK
jgi:phosphoribosylformylglycinamidine synthase